jgi:hypothetical protein
MRRVAAVFTLLIVAACAPASAQEKPPDKPTIDFSDVAKPKMYRWEAANQNCTNYTRNDALVTTIDTPEAHLIVTILPRAIAKDLQKFLIFDVMIFNKGERAFTVEPSKITLSVLGKQISIVPTLPLDVVTRSIQKHGSPSFLAGLFRPTRTATATVTDPHGNVSTVNVRVPDEAAEAEQARAEAERAARQQNRAGDTYDLGLKANTVFKGQDVAGVIFFEKKKALSDGGLILNIPLGDFTFEIPFGKARTGK